MYGIITCNLSPEFSVPLFVVFNVTTSVPVELAFFNVSVKKGAVITEWITEGESNNYGFYLERSSNQKEFVEIGFIKGNGTTLNPHVYTFSDLNISSGTYYYRLKQVDFDGGVQYSATIKVSVNAFPYKLILHQNYPNPFNSFSEISYFIPVTADIKINLYDCLGKRLMTLFDGQQSQGYHKAKLDGNELPTGVYLYELRVNNVSERRKCLLLK